jgi:hypothetical protein
MLPDEQPSAKQIEILRGMSHGSDGAPRNGFIRLFADTKQLSCGISIRSGQRKGLRRKSGAFPQCRILI